MKNDFISGFLKVFPGHSQQANPAGTFTVGSLVIGTASYDPLTITDPSAVESGFITSVAGGTLTLPDLMDFEPGVFGFFNPTTYQWINPTSLPGTCCEVIIGGAAIYKNDAISPFIKSYKTPIQLPPIKPQHVRKFQVTQACAPVQSLYAIGNLPAITTGQCCFNFVCGETYTLKIKVWGDPTYGTYFRDIERLVTADGGCCPPPDCSSGPCTQAIYVDPNYIYFQFAQQIVNDPELRQFIFPIYVHSNGNLYYPPRKFYPDITYQSGWQTWDTATITFAPNQTTPFCSNNTPPTGGIILQTSYVETRFGNCTFTVRDNYSFFPLKVAAALFDLSAAPCNTGLCFTEICPGHIAEGSGETVLRELALSEVVRGFGDLIACGVNDLRRREPEQRDQLFSIIDRNKLYVKYTIVADIPQFADPNVGNRYTDTYRIEFYALGRIPAFETAVTGWLNGCSQCGGLEVIQCNGCTIPFAPGTLPNDKFYEFAPALPRYIKIDPNKQ
jgi:hypothetical protein